MYNVYLPLPKIEDYRKPGDVTPGKFCVHEYVCVYEREREEESVVCMHASECMYVCKCIYI